MNDDQLSTLIRRDATHYAASARLKADLRTRAVLEAAADRPGANAAVFSGWLTWLQSGWQQLVFGALAGGALALAITLLVTRTLVGAPDDQQLVAAHVRALKIGPLAEVMSSDRHTVKPWFQGKLDYAPPVLDLASDGFPLMGGRLDMFNGKQSAALVYTRSQHIINVFVWPLTHDANDLENQRLLRNGFQIATWNDNGMQMSLVSDMDANEVTRFIRVWRERRALTQ